MESVWWYDELCMMPSTWPLVSPLFMSPAFTNLKLLIITYIIMYTNELWSIVQIKQPKCHPFRYSYTTANNFSISGEGPIHSWWCLCFMTCHKHMSHIQRNMVSAEKFQLWTIIIGAVINSLKKRSLQIRNSFLLCNISKPNVNFKLLGAQNLNGWDHVSKEDQDVHSLTLIWQKENQKQTKDPW